MIQRTAEARIRHLLNGFPCVGLIGPRQVGKTTLAKEIGKSFERAIYLDLELNPDLVKLEDPETYLRQFQDHLVIIDEVQRKPDLFPVLSGAHRSGQAARSLYPAGIRFTVAPEKLF